MSVAQLSPLFTWRSAIAEADSTLSATARHAALTLSLHMSERGDSCFPSLRTLGGEMGRSPATAKRAIDELARHGWLEVERGGGRGHPNRYTAVVPETLRGCNVYSETLQQESTNVASEDTFGVVNVSSEDTESVRPRPRSQEKETSSPSPAPPARTARTRARDELWDALADELGDAETRSERGRRNKALAELREIGADAEAVRAKCHAYRQRWPDIDLTASGLVANWTLLDRPPPRRGFSVDAFFEEVRDELRAEGSAP